MAPRRRSLRTLAAVTVAAVVLVGAGAAACDPEQPMKPQRSPGTGGGGISGRPEPTGPIGDRHNSLDVSTGLRPHAIEFADAYTGYLFLRECERNQCRGALFVTFDGGLSWVERKLPVSYADDLDIDLVDAATVVLRAEPVGWFRSTDTGRTFVRGGSGHPEPATVLRGVTVGCPALGDCPTMVLLDGKPLPTQPPLEGSLRGAARGRTGPIWAVSATPTQVFAVLSEDGGHTWRPVGAPVAPPSTNSVELHVAADGSDAWLVASGGTGTDAVAAYRFDRTEWRQINGKLRIGAGRIACAAAGGGVLAATSGDFGYLHPDGMWVPARPFTARYVRVLPDGTLMAWSGPGDVWLGQGNGVARRWNHVTIAAV